MVFINTSFKLELLSVHSDKVVTIWRQSGPSWIGVIYFSPGEVPVSQITTGNVDALDYLSREI